MAAKPEAQPPRRLIRIGSFQQPERSTENQHSQPGSAWMIVGLFQHDMTTQEIQHYVDAAVRSKFDDFTAESMEMMTSEGGDGRFVGKVIAIRYSGLPKFPDIFLAVGQTDKGVQIVKFGNSECLNPMEGDLDFLLLKELEIEKG